MILEKTRYKAYKNKLLAIIKVFQMWCYYSEDYKYKIIILMSHNNLHSFIDTKSLGSK